MIKFKDKKIGLILMISIVIAGIPANVVKAQECPGGEGPACSPERAYKLLAIASDVSARDRLIKLLKLLASRINWKRYSERPTDKYLFDSQRFSQCDFNEQSYRYQDYGRVSKSWIYRGR